MPAHKISPPDHHPLTIRSTRKAKKLLREIAAHTDERQYQVLERLLTAEHKKVIGAVLNQD